MSAPIPHADDLRRQWGYARTEYVFPAIPSPWLCLDLLQEPPLRRRLVEYAGPGRTLQLVPYATTRQFRQLVDVLRAEHGLNILLPESPAPENAWVRDHLDTKSGFRALAARWLPEADELLPRGFVCQGLHEAAAVAHWFGGRGQPCLVKADDGESGIGQRLIRPGEYAGPDDLLLELQRNPYLQDDLIIVEEFITAAQHLSPSLEVFVPPRGAGEPEITYLSNQLFLGLHDFYGLVISREHTQARWYPALAESGRRIAGRLQEMGYVGHFDLDTIVDEADRVYLVEVNLRRTSGTHVHEFARHYFGPDYLDDVVLLSVNKMTTGRIARYDELRDALGDLRYPMAGAQRGVICAVTSTLAACEFGCLIVAPTTAEALRLHQALTERLGAAEAPGG